jgi:hypothetical protein
MPALQYDGAAVRATDLLKANKAPPMTIYARALPYLLSWGVLALLIVVDMHRLPLALYAPVDGDWAKWNVEAILEFGNVFDLSTYNMLIPWLHPGALALALPIEDSAKNIISYSSYAAELAARRRVTAAARSVVLRRRRCDHPHTTVFRRPASMAYVPKR